MTRTVAVPDRPSGADAPWRVWCREQGVEPFDVFLDLVKRWPDDTDVDRPLNLRDIDARVDELRGAIVAAVRRLHQSAPSRGFASRTNANARPDAVLASGGRPLELTR